VDDGVVADLDVVVHVGEADLPTHTTEIDGTHAQPHVIRDLDDPPGNA
jgi:hypothetical protein